MPEGVLVSMYSSSIDNIASGSSDSGITQVSTPAVNVQFSQQGGSTVTEEEKFKAIRYALQLINSSLYGSDMLYVRKNYVY